jgi:hypothetical protein
MLPYRHELLSILASKSFCNSMLLVISRRIFRKSDRCPYNRPDFTRPFRTPQLSGELLAKLSENREGAETLGNPSLRSSP